MPKHALKLDFSYQESGGVKYALPERSTPFCKMQCDTGLLQGYQKSNSDSLNCILCPSSPIDPLSSFLVKCKPPILVRKWGPQISIWHWKLTVMKDASVFLSVQYGMALYELTLLISFSTNMEKAMAPHSCTLAWKIPWMEEPGRLQSMELQRVGHNWATEQLHFHLSLSCLGEGNGSPLQCSCLENPRDGGAWWAVVYGVAQSRTRLKRLSSSSSTH